MALRDELKIWLLDCIDAHAEAAAAIDEHTRLLGREARVDSLGLVAILASFEAEINDGLDLDLALADERAMSMTRSPFRTVGALLDYAETRVNEEREG